MRLEGCVLRRARCEHRRVLLVQMRSAITSRMSSHLAKPVTLPFDPIMSLHTLIALQTLIRPRQLVLAVIWAIPPRQPVHAGYAIGAISHSRVRFRGSAGSARCQYHSRDR